MRGAALAVLMVGVLMAGCVQGPTAKDDDAQPGATSHPSTTRPPRATTSTGPTPSSSAAPSSGPAPTPTSPPQPPLEPLPDDLRSFDCEGQPVVETFFNHGHGDAQIKSLAWASLKTGFRFAVVWHSDLQETGTLRVKVGAQPWQTYSDPTPRKSHAFVLDELPLRQPVCFQALSGSLKSDVHAARLVNAMNAFDPASGTYTVNLLTVSNAGSSKSLVESGYDEYARKLWDATDGHVRAGELLVLYNDPEDHAVIVYGTGLAPGGWVADVYFNYDYPEAAGYTWLDAIKDPRSFIVMNAIWEAGPVLSSAHEVGSVLAHEFGHYAFGALDLYYGPSCVNAAKSISIMSESREMTEFDDEANPCPAGASGSTPYTPTWTLLRKRFPAIPERDGPDAGPQGNGDEYHLSSFDLTMG